MVGDTIGATAGESNTTATRTFRIAGLLSTAIVLIRAERTSIMPILMIEVLTDIKVFVTTRTQRRENTPAPSVGSAMEGLPEAILSGGRPALGVSTAAAEDSTEAGGS